jgi:hypothetical protein
MLLIALNQLLNEPLTQCTSSVFWCGELPSPGDPGNLRLAYDPAWLQHYHSETAFFAAVPSCDVENGHTKESAKHIPWYQMMFIRDGQSIMKDRWIGRPARKQGLLLSNKRCRSALYR